MTGPSAGAGPTSPSTRLATLGHLLALHVTPASEQDRAQVAVLAETVQKATGESVTLAYVDQGYTGEPCGGRRRGHGIELEVLRLPEAKRGFVLLPRRWVAQGARSRG